MKPSKGYYSLIQYCPDLGRLEAVNVGVLLFCPERGFLKARTASGNARVKHFFGSEGHDWKRINAFKKGIEHRIERESRDIQTLEDLTKFIALRANLLQITPPRPMRVTDPAKDLDDLFCEIISEPVRRTSPRSLRRDLGERITNANLDSIVRRDIRPVNVPVFGRQVHIPFGYQNARFNLINPVPFEAADPEHSVLSACKYAVEGRSLYHNPDPELGQLQLVVVGKFREDDQESPGRVHRVLEDHRVKLYRTEELPMLFDVIRQTGKEIHGGHPS